MGVAEGKGRSKRADVVLEVPAGAAACGVVDPSTPSAASWARIRLPRWLSTGANAVRRVVGADRSRIPGAGAGSGAPGGSFHPALDGCFVGTAESCGNCRALPVRRPERSSRSARVGIRWGRRAPGAVGRSARGRGPAARGRPGRFRRVRRELARSTPHRTPTAEATCH